MMKFPHFVLAPMTIAMAVAAAACDSAGDGGDDGGDTGGSGGSTGGSSSGGTSGTGTGNTTLIPSTDGWVDREDVGNDVGVQGSWYPYGDQYGEGPSDAKCIRVGMHSTEECSIIDTPPPPPDGTGFPNEMGNMCTSGSVAQVLACPDGLMTSGCPMYDYSNMWGAGIGWDVNADKGEEGGTKRPWNPDDYDVIGFSFEIDTVPLPGLRVEIPMQLTDAEAAMVMLPSGSTTDDHPDGAPYWGATSMYPNSPVMPGVNVVLWDQIRPPRTNYVFDKARMLGIQFHVPANTMTRGEYSFCIKNVTMLRTQP